MKRIPKGTLVLPDRMDKSLFHDLNASIYGLAASYVSEHHDDFVPTIVSWTFDESAIVPFVPNSDSAVVLVRLPKFGERYNGFWVNPSYIEDI